MIAVEEVSKVYRGRPVIDRLSLAVAEGEFCALLGSSGAGKSTLLRMVNRLVPFDSGVIRVAGEDIRALPPEQLRRRIGYAIQSVGLFPHWTVGDNIATVPRLLKWPEARVRARVEELLRMLRLDPAIYHDRYPHLLSGGEQQRVGVARALAADPKVLLMDEPFGALDPVTRDALQTELAQIHRATGKTVLFVTHDIDEALRLATRIAILDRGRVVQAGTPLDIIERPADEFVRGFVGVEGSGLRLLSLHTVGERLRRGEAAPGEPVPLDTSLRQALSVMTARRAERLAVCDGGGAVIGAVLLADIVQC